MSAENEEVNSTQEGEETGSTQEEEKKPAWEPDYDFMAQEFMRGKMEGLFAKAHKTPNPKPSNRLKNRVKDFDPTVFSNRKFITPSKPPKQVDFKKGFMF